MAEVAKNLRKRVYFGLMCVLLLAGSTGTIHAEENSRKRSDTTARAPEASQTPDAEVVSEKEGLVLTIRNVDITEFPEISIIVEAFDENGMPLDTIYNTDLTVLENGEERRVISVEKISVNERVPVDFVFIIDVTGSMQSTIDAVRNNIINFTSSLVRRGIDYQLGLVLFSDVIEKAYPPNGSVIEFLNWLANVRASGGLDFNENALEALATAAQMSYRPSANRVYVMITDAPYHQKGGQGQGVTNFTTETIVDYVKKKDARVFCIVPDKLTQYQTIAQKTRGAVFDIGQPFAKILDNFSNQLTNLYALKYESLSLAIPDSLEIGILDSQRRRLIMQQVPIAQIGRKLIIKNLLFKVGSSELSNEVPQLDTIAVYMQRKPKVKIRVEGHTDSQGPAALNERLSRERAQAVKNYLTKLGVETARIRIYGYGESRPIAPNDTEFGRSLNRRTEIVIDER